MAPDDHLDTADEKARYETHNNDVNDERYQEFVSPIVDAVTKNFTTGKSGLDYGSGIGPVISHLLKAKGYVVDQHDPIFDNNPMVFRNRYDFIVCCEVIEHFRHPAREFLKLNQLLKPNGKLICMTDLLTPDVKFPEWYYKDDPTHIFFYRKETIKFVQKAFGFSASSIDSRTVIFETE